MIEMVEKIPKVTYQRVAKAVFELRSLLIYMETQQKSGAVV
jgi:hypothetical protein